MPSDRIVTPGHILKAVMEYERRGATALLTELETLEPDLTEFMLETLTRVFHQLIRLGLSDASARKPYRQTRKLVVISVLALRNAQRELWDSAGNPPEGADPPPTP